MQNVECAKKRAIRPESSLKTVARAFAGAIIASDLVPLSEFCNLINPHVVA
ncbi:MAG: hypothetical protein JNG88_15115 [Phycisphaerales bacterium]|nr:hypothetical protein [Phycisphaerales bacterium]